MAKLSDLLIDEVSLVRKGANQHAHVAIAKSADNIPGGTVDEYFDEAGNPVDANSLEDGQIVFDETGQAFQYDENADEADIDEDELEYDEVGKAFGAAGPARAGLRGAGFRGAQRLRGAAGGAKRRAGTAGSMARGFGSDVSYGARQRRGNGLNAAAGATPAAPGNVANGVRGAQDAVAGFARSSGGRAGIAGALGLGAGGGGGYAAGRRVNKSFEDDVRTELSKALTDDDRDAVISKAFGYMQHLESEISKAQQVAEEEREARLDAEFLDIAKSYTLPVSDEELADALRAMAEVLDPEQVEVIQKCLEIASDAIEAEYGSSGGGDNDDIMAQVNAQAERFARHGSGDVTKSFEGITADVFGANPEAYDAYLQDNPAQLGR